MRKKASKRLTSAQREELKSLAARPDNAIDTSDAPELSDWSGAKRGVFYRTLGAEPRTRRNLRRN
jgi:hypothetical protein